MEQLDINPYLKDCLDQYTRFLTLVRDFDNYYWQTGDKWETEEGQLTREWIQFSLVEYHKWFLSQKTRNKSHVVDMPPTFEVFFIWQTHMLHPVDYQRDCQQILGFNLVPTPFQHSTLHPPSLSRDFWTIYRQHGLQRVPGDPSIGPIQAPDREKLDQALKLFSVRDFLGSAWKQIVFSRKILGQRPVSEIEHPFIKKVAIERYHKFLTLIQKYDHHKKLFTPTLDIDLVWHAHQLNPEIYQTDCKKILGRTINHDDNPPVTDMEEGNVFTCQKWFEYFGKRIMVKHFFDQSVTDQTSSQDHYYGGFFNFAACGTAEYYQQPCNCA